jgi:hypothetical protein
VTLGGSQHGRRGPVQDRQHLFRLGLAKVLVPFQGLLLGGVHWDDRRIIVGIVMLPVALTGFGLARMPNCERWWLGAASVLVISSNRAATLVGLALAIPTLVRQMATWRGAQTASRWIKLGPWGKRVGGSTARHMEESR